MLCSISGRVQYLAAGNVVYQRFITIRPDYCDQIFLQDCPFSNCLEPFVPSTSAHWKSYLYWYKEYKDSKSDHWSLMRFTDESNFSVPSDSKLPLVSREVRI
ncbi:hypothetical protein TNCV_2786801 [Trichonephila clavipes]|nr:hypothetical protein TNCV_2786801 [Trichonephila clavipes]